MPAEAGDEGDEVTTFVGRGSWVVGRGSWVAWVVGRGSWVVGREALSQIAHWGGGSVGHPSSIWWAEVQEGMHAPPRAGVSTIHDPRPTNHEPRTTNHDPRPTTHDPRTSPVERPRQDVRHGPAEGCGPGRCRGSGR